MARPDAKVASALRAAVALATTRKHVTAGPAHVLSVLLSAPPLCRRLRARGIEPDSLEEGVARVLADAPAGSAYRDVVASLCPSVERALRRAAPWPRRSVHREALAVALSDEPSVRPFRRAAVLDVSILDGIGPSIGEALLCLLGDPEVARRIAAGGGSADALRAAAAELRATPGLATIDVAAAGLVRAARLAGHRALSREMLLAPLLPRVLGRALGKDDRERAEVLLAIVHGGRPVEADPALADEDAEIVLLDDPVTTQEAVIDVLREVFGFDASAARAQMLEVHWGGEAVVARLRADRARALAAIANARARRGGHPLLVVVRSAGRAY